MRCQIKTGISLLPLPDLRQSFISRVSPLDEWRHRSACNVWNLWSRLSSDYHNFLGFPTLRGFKIYVWLRSICTRCTVRSIETVIFILLFGCLFWQKVPILSPLISIHGAINQISLSSVHLLPRWADHSFQTSVAEFKCKSNIKVKYKFNS